MNPERSKEENISTIANRYTNYSKTEKPSKYDKKDYNEKSTSKFDKKDYDKSTSKYDKKDYDKITSKYDKKDYDKPGSKFDKKDYFDKPLSKYDKKDYVDKSLLKYEKKDFNKLNIPSLTTNRSRDVSPVSTSSKYSLTRPSRHVSPDRRTTKTFKDKSRDSSPVDREKDIPNKTDKSSGYNSLSNFKLYPRSSNYTRPASRAETKPEVTVNRYSITNRLSSNYLRSPPTVTRASVSPVNFNDIPREKPKNEVEKSTSPVVIIENANESQEKSENKIIENGIDIIIEDENEDDTETVTIITRHTSPTPPGSSAYVRARRADMAKTVEKTVTRAKKRPQMIDKETQHEKLDDRSSRFVNTARTNVTNWSLYTPTATNYTGYAGRFSTQYPSLRDKSGGSHSDRSSRSHSTERIFKDVDSSSQSENLKNSDKSESLKDIPEIDQSNISVYESKDDETSEIIINVNLKFKKAKSPLTVTTAELASPEITVTNSQLPPQVPKPEGTGKIKKVKARKSSTDSSDSGSKKKIIKRRSKSVSSTDSDHGSATNEKQKEPSLSLPKSETNSPSNSLQNGHVKLEHSKSRESNSPESSITLSTQSSISEDDTISKSKANDTSRTSADETSIPTDRSAKQSSPVGNQKECGTEEAKSFLIRALAPVTNLFKMRHQDSNEIKSWPENSTSESTGKDVSNIQTESEKSTKNNTNNIVASNEDNIVKLKAIRHIESGERAWWLDPQSDKQSTNKSPSEKNLPNKIRHIESGERAWWLESNGSDNKTGNSNNSPQQNASEHIGKPLKKCKFVDDEKPWWLDSCANIPEGVEQLTPPRKSSSDSDKSEKYNFYKVRHIESGEQKDWWLTSNENSLSNNKPEGQNSQNSLSKSGSDQRGFPLRRIRHVESGERPWWLASDKNIPEGIEKLPTPPPQPDSDSSDSEEVQVYAPSNIPPFPLSLPDDEPLGARRSPEGLETPKVNEDYNRGRVSPYENNCLFKRRSMANLSYPKGMDKYISRYTDIDDILGTSGQIYSPFMDSILARRTGQMHFDDDECEEIDPTQVRIHDSTAQMPVIKKLRGR